MPHRFHPFNDWGTPYGYNYRPRKSWHGNPGTKKQRHRIWPKSFVPYPHYHDTY